MQRDAHLILLLAFVSAFASVQLFVLLCSDKGGRQPSASPGIRIHSKTLRLNGSVPLGQVAEPTAAFMQ